jgi:predicted GH43/DUF377 family glycosyl hydrolase
LNKVNPSALRRTYPLGVFGDHDSVALIGREKYSATYQLVFGIGHDRNFQLRAENPQIVLPLGRKEHLLNVSDVRISTVLQYRIMTYTATQEGRAEVRVAVHDHEGGMDVWDVTAVSHQLTGNGMVVPEYRHEGQYALYYGARNLHLALSKNLVAWHATEAPVLSPRHDCFDKHALSLVSVALTSQGLLVLYQTQETKRGKTTLAVGTALFAADDPSRLLWRSETPLYEYQALEKDKPRLLGGIVENRTITLYLSTLKQKLIVVELPNPYVRQPHRGAAQLHRYGRNPILSPTFHEWESHAVLNPAAFVDQERVHLLYRAMGPDGISRLGYASSSDGIHFDERLDKPVFVPGKGFGSPTPNAVHGKKAYDIIENPSGGGWAGCEDPRAVKIDGKVHLSFVAFDGWQFVRQAMTSISLENIHKHKWNWKKPVLVSKPGEIQKNWVLFPEKINGKYAILHGLSPKIHIQYIDDLKELNGKNFINSLPQVGGRGYHDPSRQHHWDNVVRGAGAPPLKTSLGWLQLYHALDKSDPGKYKIGAMVLDLEDPAKVLFRTNEPILAPKEWYENDGKPGVVYTCGAVILGENLIVYYGGGDKHIAAARANVEQFLNALTAGTQAELVAQEVSLTR